MIPQAVHARLNPPSLDELALKHGTDKSSIGHGYTRWYERHFERERPQALLEIGVGRRAASLKMWNEWAPEWVLYGIDNDWVDTADSGAVVIWRADQNDAARLWEIAKGIRIDIIIDDGSHEARGQITSFETLFPLLRHGGWYCVEDLHTSFPSREGYGGLQYFKDLADDVCGEGRFDLGEPRNLPYFAEIRDTLPYNVRWIESIYFYPNLVMIRKRGEEL